MPEVTGYILKADQVELQGQFHLDIGQAGPSSPKLITPQARIVENHPEFAVMEITCCCGAKTYLKCEYATGQTQNDSSAASNHEPDKTK